MTIFVVKYPIAIEPKAQKFGMASLRVNLEVRVLVTFYHPYAHVGGGAFRRFLGVKEVWEKMGVKMCILESSPKLITPSIEVQ